MVVKQAIIPNLSIDHCLKNWKGIKKRLKENDRKRLLQTTLYLKNYV